MFALWTDEMLLVKKHTTVMLQKVYLEDEGFFTVWTRVICTYCKHCPLHALHAFPWFSRLCFASELIML